MDILIEWKKFETVFEGDEISMELFRLTTGAHLVLTPFVDLFKTQEEIDELKKNEASMIKLQEGILNMQQAVRPILEDHVRNIQGITINGKPVRAEQLADFGIFVNLVSEIMAELLIRATITKEQEKNSERPSECGAQDSGQTA